MLKMMLQGPMNLQLRCLEKVSVHKVVMEGAANKRFFCNDGSLKGLARYLDCVL